MKTNFLFCNKKKEHLLNIGLFIYLYKRLCRLKYSIYNLIIQGYEQTIIIISKLNNENTITQIIWTQAVEKEDNYNILQRPSLQTINFE